MFRTKMPPQCDKIRKTPRITFCSVTTIERIIIGMSSFDSLELIGLKEVMEMLHVSRKEATHILNMPGCPILPRHKGQRFRVRKEAFINWFKDLTP